MAYSLRKIQMMMTTLAITATGLVQAQYAPQYSYAPEDCCAPESCCPSGKFLFGAELLYLSAYEGGLVNVCDSTNINDTIENDVLISTLEGSSHDLRPRWNAGYRVGAGYEFANGKSGIGAVYTHFNSNTNKRNCGDKNHWKLDFDVVDVFFAYQCNLTGCCINFTPYSGLRYASIDQKLRSHFVNTVTRHEDPIVFSESDSSFSESGSYCSESDSYSDFSSSPVEFTSSTSCRHFKEDFWGLGPIFGIEADWAFGCNGLSLYGNFSVGTLYGKFHVSGKQDDVFDSGINVNHLRKHVYAFQLVYDSEFGIRWKKSFCEKSFIVQFGLEQHRYFNHNQFCSYGDLTLDGVNLAVGMEF